MGGPPQRSTTDMQIMHLQIHHMFTIGCESVHTHVRVHTPTRHVLTLMATTSGVWIKSERRVRGLLHMRGSSLQFIGGKSERGHSAT